MPKILISDAMDSIAEKILMSNKIDVDIKTDFNVDELKDKISTYDGLIIADGGIQKNHLNSLEDIGVDIAVQGGAIFG